MKKSIRFLLFVLTIATVVLSACGGKTATPSVGVGKAEPIPAAFVGLVESMAGDQWVINGNTVTVPPDVIRDGPFSVGDQVKVEGVVNSDGAFMVAQVEAPTSADISSLPSFGADQAGVSNSNETNTNDVNDVNINDDNGDDVNSNDDNSNTANSNDANTNDDSINDTNSNDDNGNDVNSNDDNGNDTNSNDDNSNSDNSNDSNSNDDNSNSGGGEDNGGGNEDPGGSNDNGSGG